MLRPLAFALMLLAAATASAAPLCRDSKGAFTPCTPNQTRQIVRKAHEDEVRTERKHPPAAEVGVSGAPATGAAKTRAPKKPLVARSRLCRDSKGLFTPCPR